MAIRRRCNGRTCKNGRRCLEHLWFDVMYRGTRFRMPANEFAIPRMEPGKQRPIGSLEEARDWERLFIGEIKAGRDPRRPRRSTKARRRRADGCRWLSGRVHGALREAGGAEEREVDSAAACAALKEHLGELPLDALEEPDDINRFKTESDYAEEVEIATIHRALETLRAAMNWGMAQTPPLFKKSPFHRFGVRHEQEGGDDARSSAAARGREAAARRGAAEDEHRRAPVRRTAAARPHHRRAGALLPARRDAADPEQAGELGDAARSAFLARRPRTRRTDGFRSIRKDGSRRSSNADRRSDPRPTCSGRRPARTNRTSRPPGKRSGCSAHGIEPKAGRQGAAWNREQLQRIDLRWHDLRHEGACRLLADGVDIRIIQLMLGHASIQQTQRYLNVTDEELRRGLEVSWNNKGRPLRLASGA